MFRGSFKLNFKLLTSSFAPFRHSGCVTNTNNQKHFIWLSFCHQCFRHIAFFCMFFHFLWKYKCFKTPIVFPPAHLWSSFHFRDMDWSTNIHICILFFWFFSQNKNEKMGCFAISGTLVFHLQDIDTRIFCDQMGWGWVGFWVGWWNFETMRSSKSIFP